MSYLKAGQDPAERIIHHAHAHWIVIVPGLVLLCVSLVAATGFSMVFGAMIGFVALVNIVQGLIYLLFSELVITDQRVIVKRGFISRNVIEISNARIEAISVQQSVLGRLLDYGSVNVIGIGGTTAPLAFVHAPLALKRSADKIMVVSNVFP